MRSSGRHPCRSLCVHAQLKSPSGWSAAKYYALHSARPQGFATPFAIATALAVVLITGAVFFCRRPPRPVGAVVGCPCRPCPALPARFRGLPAAAVGLGLVCFLLILGCVMSGFVSVLSRRGAGVVGRPLSGGWVWARRALPAGPGWSPAPACLFVPFAGRTSARAFAIGVAALGWHVWVRPGAVGAGVWSACGLPVPPWAVKLALPAGLSCYAARTALAGLRPSSLAWAL